MAGHPVEGTADLVVEPCKEPYKVVAAAGMMDTALLEGHIVDLKDIVDTGPDHPVGEKIEVVDLDAGVVDREVVLTVMRLGLLDSVGSVGSLSQNVLHHSCSRLEVDSTYAFVLVVAPKAAGQCYLHPETDPLEANSMTSLRR